MCARTFQRSGAMAPVTLRYCRLGLGPLRRYRGIATAFQIWVTLARGDSRFLLSPGYFQYRALTWRSTLNKNKSKRATAAALACCERPQAQLPGSASCCTRGRAAATTRKPAAGSLEIALGAWGGRPNRKHPVRSGDSGPTRVTSMGLG
jgi:hypothetical protein